MDDSQSEPREMAVDSQDTPVPESQDLWTSSSRTFIPPSIHKESLLSGSSYTYYSAIPPTLAASPQEEVCLGIDEAGRGPVLGGMVYAALYLPISAHRNLLATTYRFDDSKVLTPGVRSNLMALLCREGHPLHGACGWATRLLSARAISAGMLKATGSYNLNAQATDATVELIKGVLERGVNVREIYIDTVGQPAAHQKKLERVFPTISITVAKKADSLYPCVSAASVCAKVTRDVALEVCWEEIVRVRREEEMIEGNGKETAGWGSGYPSDAKCVAWLKSNMDPVFGWGNECRFSWGTAKDMLEDKGDLVVKADWPDEEDLETSRVTDYFARGNQGSTGPDDELKNWFGTSVGMEVF